MTDNEIIKALECCKMPVGSGACNGCPLKTVRDSLRKEDTKSCTTILLENALDLINRQKAELKKKDTEIDILIRKKETLRDEISELRAEIDHYKGVIKLLEQDVATANAEVERLKYTVARCRTEIQACDNDYKRACAERDARIVTNNFIKAEAYKEFAERLKGKCKNPLFPLDAYETFLQGQLIREIDTLVKELTEGNGNE